MFQIVFIFVCVCVEYRNKQVLEQFAVSYKVINGKRCSHWHLMSLYVLFKKAYTETDTHSLGSTFTISLLFLSNQTTCFMFRIFKKLVESTYIEKADIDFKIFSYQNNYLISFSPEFLEASCNLDIKS